MNKLRTYGNWAGNPEGVPEDITRCIAEIWGDRTFRSQQCLRKRGYGKDGLYCKQHDPERIAQKNKEKEEQYKKEQAIRNERWRRQRILDNLAADITTEELLNYKLVKREE